jgi:hypothetical protein
MKISGFTFIRNAILYDYPVVESIMSILPICDEFVVAVGESDDATLELIRGIDSSKIKIVETRWDMSLRDGGRVLAMETDKALAHISSDSDWCFYIQGDEVVHEKYLDTIQKAMLKYKSDSEVQGLLFKYLHFYGSYDFVGDSRKWYRREIRIIRNGLGIKSYKDAQGFRLGQQKLKVKLIDTYIYHYGWVKPPELQSAKINNFMKLWHSDSYVKKHQPKNQFDYSTVDSLARFQSEHPQVMKNRISRKNWSFDFDPTKKKFGLVSYLLYKLEHITGYRAGEYKNYIRI